MASVKAWEARKAEADERYALQDRVRQVEAERDAALRAEQEAARSFDAWKATAAENAARPEAPAMTPPEITPERRSVWFRRIWTIWRRRRER
jgi:hypothetical protein